MRAHFLAVGQACLLLTVLLGRGGGARPLGPHVLVVLLLVRANHVLHRLLLAGVLPADFLVILLDAVVVLRLPG